MAKRDGSILRSVKTEPAKLQDRVHIALRATWQLSSVLAAIAEVAQRNDHDELPVDGHLLALTMRATDLNNLMSSALGDEICDVADLLRRLNEGDPE